MANLSTSDEPYLVFSRNVSSRFQVSSESLHDCKADYSLITYYLTSVLTQMGLGAEMSRIISGVNGTCYFLTS